MTAGLRQELAEMRFGLVSWVFVLLVAEVCERALRPAASVAIPNNKNKNNGNNHSR